MSEKETEKPLHFQPLTPGLGFHPFSDGLPYTPVRKGHQARLPKPMGTGAEAAGTPRFSFPKTGSAAASATAPATMSRPLGSPARETVTREALAARQPLPPAVESSVAPAETPFQPQLDLGVGYLVRRVAAYLIDLFFASTTCALAFGMVLYQSGASLADIRTPGVILLAGVFLLFFAWALTAAQEMITGSSIGKRLLGLRIDGRPTDLFLRSIYFIPSVAFLGLGLLWALFSREKRCWHDVVMDLQPRRIARL